MHAAACYVLPKVTESVGCASYPLLPMEAIDPSDVRKVLTEEQLRRGAEGITYRVQQLVWGTLVLDLQPYHQQVPRSQEGRVLTTNNALVESGIVHARSLAYFLRDRNPKRGDLHYTHYSKSAWRDSAERIDPIATHIIEQTSRRLSHTTIGGREWEPHPGDWPLPEMAVLLSRGLADLVEALGEKYRDRALLFGETPLFEYENIRLGLPTLRTPISDHPEVGNLTKALQEHLAPTGWPDVIHDQRNRPRT